MIAHIHLFDPKDPFSNCDHAFLAEDLPAILDNCIDTGLIWAYAAYADKQAIQHWDEALVARSADQCNHHNQQANRWADIRNELITLHDKHVKLRSN